MAVQKEDFEYLQRFAHERLGLVLDEGKEYLVETRLHAVLREEGFDDLGALTQALRSSPPRPGLTQRVVESLTTHETSFFRDSNFWTALREVVLPRLASAPRSGPMRIWCAAASSGQEPYSLCLLLKERFPELLARGVDFVATDISERILSRSREAEYSQLEVGRGLPATMLVKYFDNEGTRWRLRPELRSMVRFEKLNLLGPWPSFPPLDLILMRNVLIYFSREDKTKILHRARAALRPEGCLFLGGAETTLNLDNGFERENVGAASCYRPKAA